MAQRRVLSVWSRRSFLSLATAAAGIAGIGVLTACGGGTTATTASSTSAGSVASASTAATSSVASTSASSVAATTAAASSVATTNTSATATSAATSSAAVAVATGPTPTAGPPVFGKGSTNLLFLNGLGGADGETMKQMLGNYVKENPKVAIDFQTLGWDDVFKKLDTTLVAGTPPELVVMHATEIPQYGSRNALQPVDTWFAKKLLPKEDWSPSVLAKATYEGKILAVPLDIHDYNCYISVDLLKQNGIDPEKPPVGQEFIAAAQKVSHQTPNSLGTATFGTSGFGGFGTMALLWQYGGDVLSPDGKDVTINSQQAQDAMQMYNDLVYKYKIYPQPGVKYGDLNPPGRVAWRTDGSWAYNYYKDHHLAPPQVMAGQFPQIGAKPVVWMNSHELTIPVGISGTKFDEAQKLILWISNHNVDWAQSGQPPARLSAQNSPTLKEDWAWSVRTFADVTTKYGRYEVSPPQYTQVRNLQYKAFDEVLANKKPVKTILDDYATQIKGVLTH